MENFVESVFDRESAATLRGRLDDESYLFFPGLLPASAVLDVRREVVAVLGARGWLASDGDPFLAVVGKQARREDHHDTEWLATYDRLQRLQSLHELAHHPAIAQVMSALVGERLLVHPRKILRVMTPESLGRATPAHQDYRVVQGSADVLTAWIPLGECPGELGGLRVLRGSTRLGLLPVEQAEGPLGQRLPFADDDPRWVSSEFRAGDVLVFHSMTIHSGLTNSSDRFRLSVDSRYQSADDPITVGSLLPYYFPLLPGWEELTRGWSSLRGISFPQMTRFPATTFDAKSPNLPMPTSRLVRLSSTPHDADARARATV